MGQNGGRYEVLSSKLSNLVNDLIFKHCQNYSGKLEVECDEYNKILQIQQDYTINNNNMKLNISLISEAFEWTAGVELNGALALWPSSLGNLGAYILISWKQSLQVSSIGGTATAISAISAIVVVLWF